MNSTDRVRRVTMPRASMRSPGFAAERYYNSSWMVATFASAARRAVRPMVWSI
jgi:hypothetical protein